MNILMVTRGYPHHHNGGLGIFERDQAIALKLSGHRVAYAVIDSSSIRHRRKLGYHKYTDRYGIEVYEMNWPVGHKSDSLIRVCERRMLNALYLKIIKDFGRPDIVHAHFLRYADISTSLCRREALPLVMTEHSYLAIGGKPSDDYLKWARSVFDDCDKVIAVSTDLANNINRLTGYSDTIVIHNVSNINDFTPLECIGDKVLFVSAGVLLPDKGFDILIEAFAEAIKERPDIKLLILGFGQERQRLENLIKQLGMTDSVGIHGMYWKTELPELCRSACAFVLPSRYETFGVVYAEAMSMGLPVIATRCGGPEDFMNSSTGYMVSPDDVPGLTDAIIKMADNWSSFDRAEIAAHAKRRFSPEVIAGQLTEVYGTVIKKSKETV